MVTSLQQSIDEVLNESQQELPLHHVGSDSIAMRDEENCQSGREKFFDFFPKIFDGVR